MKDTGKGLGLTKSLMQIIIFKANNFLSFIMKMIRRLAAICRERNLFGLHSEQCNIFGV